MKRHAYNLGFISDEDIYQHVRSTVMQYRRSINLTDFNSNIVDPIKLTFDAKVYGKSFDEIIEEECLRQIDKTNTNKIGYFHQNLFSYANSDWVVPKQGFDIVNKKRHIYVELKNKHNTMNSASSQSTYMKMQAQILSDDKAVCMLVEVIAKHSGDNKWVTTLKGNRFAHDRIRRVSMDKFYEIVFGEPDCFFRLCKALPLILDDVICEFKDGFIENSVLQELNELSSDTLKSLYLLAFAEYEGFGSFK